MFKFLLEALKNASGNIASQRQNKGLRSFQGHNKQRETLISSSKFKNLNIELKKEWAKVDWGASESRGNCSVLQTPRRGALQLSLTEPLSA